MYLILIYFKLNIFDKKKNYLRVMSSLQFVVCRKALIYNASKQILLTCHYSTNIMLIQKPDRSSILMNEIAQIVERTLKKNSSGPEFKSRLGRVISLIDKKVK